MFNNDSLCDIFVDTEVGEVDSENTFVLLAFPSKRAVTWLVQAIEDYLGQTNKQLRDQSSEVLRAVECFYASTLTSV